jgi:hypothetical protein
LWHLPIEADVLQRICRSSAFLHEAKLLPAAIARALD